MTITPKLLKWYLSNRRDLPWRRTRNPYEIWVSEIILQQTRVEQGLAYYLRFLERFPDIRSLAEAETDEVLRVWQGLGYYSRGRNMQAAAMQIMKQYKGIFPDHYEGILSLKGVGPYTAAAIASICFGEPTPVADGNVLRFLARLYGVEDPVDASKGRKRVSALAAGLMDPRRPGDFNQAMMEFGATWCRPQNPVCGNCIFNKECIAYNNGMVRSIPVKAKPKKSTDRYFHYLVVRLGKVTEGRIFLHKREGKDIWKGLYEFPLIETAKPVSEAKLVQSEEWKQLFKGTSARFIRSGKVVKHQLSHQVIHARFCEVAIRKALKGDYLQVSEKQMKKYPLPRLIERFFNPVRV